MKNRLFLPLWIAFSSISATSCERILCDNMHHHTHLDILQRDSIIEQYLYFHETGRLIHSNRETVFYDGIPDSSSAVLQRFDKLRETCKEQSISITYREAR